ncbi:MAG TPA: redoxin family protein [Steroidobacteraceae bacterium]|jgi:thiol-disulfide isomerase/thioredoxin|nr:redoxin family protein [Steroidobacteraceae bacterium]
MKGIKGIALPLLAWAVLTSAASPTKPPEFTHHHDSDWINSPPLTLAALKGKVVLVEFWAFECVNCLNSRPWLEALERDKSAAGLVIIGVHRPELPSERSPAAVRDAVQRLGIHYPVMLDGDSSYWNALHTRYWPTFYLIGRDGLMYPGIPGEMHLDDDRGAKMNALIDLLLKAPAS